jgi:predicted metal-dependent hydrolase
MERWATNARLFAARGGLETIVMKVPYMVNPNNDIMQTKEYFRDYYQRNREKRLAYQNKYNKEHRKTVNEYQKTYERKTEKPSPIIIQKGVVVRFD